MPFDGGAFEDFQQALMSAFPTRAGLTQLARFDLNAKLNEIAPATATHDQAVFNLIEWAEQKGKLRTLGEKAKERNPDNPLLARFDLDRLLAGPTVDEIIDAAPVVSRFKDDVRSAWIDLGSDNAALQITAATALQQLLVEPSADELATVFAGTLANIKMDYPDAVVRELVKVLATALNRLAPTLTSEQQTWLDGASEPYDPCALCAQQPGAAGVLHPEAMDLARARLPRIELPNLDLRMADIAFANLDHANLTGMNLCRVRGYGVHLRDARLSRSNLEEARLRRAIAPQSQFHDARMVSLRLEEADLAGAEFHQARLQGAHFNEANLTGAQFQGAQLADSDFRAATIDDACARSVVGSFNWRKAKFDPHVLAQLELLAAE